MNITLAIIALVVAAISLVIGICLLVKVTRTSKQLKNVDKELATTMIMNFKDYDKNFEENNKVQKDIQRDNLAIMNEINKIKEVIKTLNNGFTVPSFKNVE